MVAVLSLGLGVTATMVILGYRPWATPMQTQGAGEEKRASGHEGMRGGAEGLQPAGKNGKGVYISSARQQLIGVRTAPIGHQEIGTTIRTVGTLAYDETRLAQVHTKIAGWVDRVFINYVGKAVRRDEPLFTVYSPELVSTQNEYLLALKAKSQLGASQVPATRTAVESLLSAALDRLKLWDIPEEHIAELERTGKVQRTLMLHSPFDGVVLERNAFPGQYITPEMTAFKVADLSNIWALGAVFEYELPLIKIGQEVEIEFPYEQARRTLKGKITFIYPEIDPQTRRARIRTESRNPGLQFKPETYVTVLIHTGGGHRLAIPKEAVIDTGAKRYALVALPDGYFEPREVKVGEPGDDFYPLLGGLDEGEKVVTSAQFLIDSETNLQAAMQSMIGMPGMETKGGGGGMEGMEMPAEPETSREPSHAGHEKP